MHNRLVRLAQSMAARPGITLAWSLLAAGFLYFGILTRGSFGLANKTGSGFAFNSMLLHLLQGQFDVDPDTIANEGFVVNGKVYSYFGIFPALFRLLFLPFVDLTRTNVTTISCLVADLIAVGAQLGITLKIFRRFGVAGREYLFLSLVVTALISGPQLFLLRPSIYQESVYWALAFSYAFLYFLLDIFVLGRAIAAGALTVMATLAGLTLLTRVSVSIALYGAMAIVYFHILLSTENGERRSPGQMLASIAKPQLVLPAVVLLGFAVATGYVNFMRFGNPLEFMDLRHHLMSIIENPDRIPRLQQYGEFNPARIWYGVLYYFIPVWMLRDASGILIFSDFRHNYMDMVELPPGSFLLSDPLILALGGIAIARMVGRRPDPAGSLVIVALTAALAVPAVLDLSAISYSARYRGDFYPLFLFLAFVGLRSILAQSPDDYRRATLPRIALPLTGISVVSGVILLGLYWLSPFGDAERFLKDGWIKGYESRLRPAPSAESPK